MSRSKKRIAPSASSALRRQLRENESLCSLHVGRIISLAKSYKPYKKFPDHLRDYGITAENFETDELLKLCREWNDTDDEEDFFNTVGKGDVLEALLRKRCDELGNLHLVDQGRQAELKRRSTRRKKAN